MPASTNFLDFNPSLTNAETDGNYSINPMRTGGYPLDALWPSVFANKVTHQANRFVAAFCQMLVNKGYSPRDDNFSNLVAILTNVLTTADAGALITVVPYSSAVTFDVREAAKFDLTLTGNVSSSTLVNPVSGQWLVFLISQDSVGNRTFVWPTTLTNPGPIGPQPYTTSVQAFVVRPNGAIVPATPMLWITQTGVIVTPLPAVVSIAASGNVSSANQEILELVSATSGNITRGIYTAIGYRGYRVRLKKVDATYNLVTFQPLVGGQTIDGQSSVSILKQNDSLEIMSDGANWQII
ncbi:MAG TPA: hypothetical protein VJ801_04010 [Polyangia bacterium]|jgi:hypothetical protein|nr:hypothetical protein [Polyangia bacterium]